MEIAIIKALCAEFRDKLVGLRVIEVTEGGKGEVFLLFKGKSRRLTLLINPRPELPRMHLISAKPDTSREPDPFTQSLKNNIAGSELTSIEQTGFERVVTLNLLKKDRRHTLIFEMTGKKPGLILADEAGKVVLAQSYVPISDDVKRPILPGLAYQPPPRPKRQDPYALTKAAVEGILRNSPEMEADKALLRSVGGISPLMAAEGVAIAGIPPEPGKVLAAINALIERVGKGPYEPRIYETPGGPVLSAFPLSMYKNAPVKRFDSMNEAAENYYSSLIGSQETASFKASFLREAKVKLDAARRKLKAIENDFSKSGRADEYQLMGQLLMASQGSVPKDADSVTLPDLFSQTGGKVTISLDPKLSPVRNAEAYFRKAKKARAGAAILRDRLARTQEEMRAQESLIKKIGRTMELEELQALSGRAPVNSRQLRGEKKKGGHPSFPSFKSSDGFEVVYAKNARMNDLLTFKLAEPMDLWLHAQGYHGAHVIVRNPERRPDIPLQTILQAAEVAAYFSEGKKDNSVAVDYTFKKYVRKPKNPVPGQALFTNNKTVFVEPRKP